MTIDKHSLSSTDLRELVETHPLAWITTGSSADFHATLLPLRPFPSGKGDVTHFVGHFPRSHPQVELLNREQEAWLLFLGPNAYASPSWLTDRTQAPTWNYVSLRCRVELGFVDDPKSLRGHLEELVEAMEGNRPAAWLLNEMGDRYAALAARIILFEAKILEIVPTLKLGQTERDDVYIDIIAGLEAAGEGDLATWMYRYNPTRKT